LEIDLDNSRVQASYPSIYLGSLLFSGLFGFDCALFGYVKSSNSFIRIETVGKTQPIGVAKRLNTVNFLQTAGIDACSCPQTVKFEKTASKIISKDTCSRDYKFVFQFDNECNADQKNVDFSDKFPGDFLIKKIERQPFGGTMSGGPGNRDIAIKGMNIPSVKDSIVIIAALAENYKDSLYKNQALLKNLVYPDGTLYAQVSDNPYTIKSNDSTSVNAPINLQFDRDTVSICQNGEIKLKPRTQGANLQYKWNTGALSSALAVDKPGNYRVTVTSECFSKVDSILVIDSPLTVNIGPDLAILPGDSILFKPEYQSYNPIKSSNWTANSGALLACKNCFNNVVRIRADATTVKIKLTDEQGCIAEDEVLINTRRKIYIPNAFSPNDDGYNDYFFINTEYEATLVQFEIYNRWGDKIFESRDLCKSNSQSCSWDGKFKGQLCDEGIYVWKLHAVSESRASRNGGVLEKNLTGEILLYR
jgi:gliding motility-associated-like protein